MFTVAALVLAAAVGAVAFRIRGGWWGDLWGVSGQASRAIYAVLMAGIVMCSGNPWPVDGWRLALLAVAFAAAWFLGAVVLGTLGAIDAGRREGTPLVDGLRNAARGIVYALPAAAVLAAFRAVHGDEHGAWAAGLMLFAGAMQGIMYEAAWRWRPLPRWKPTEWAEGFTGACLGLGAAAAALA